MELMSSIHSEIITCKEECITHNHEKKSIIENRTRNDRNNGISIQTLSYYNYEKRKRKGKIGNFNIKIIAIYLLVKLLNTILNISCSSKAFIYFPFKIAIFILMLYHLIFPSRLWSSITPIFQKRTIRITV